MAEDRYGTEDDEVELERTRLGVLAEARDPRTRSVFDRIGVADGARALELGAGTGSVAAMLAELVGPSGSVISTDIDLQFHDDMPDNVTVLQHDIEHEAMPDGRFDVIHARALLQHVPSRVEVIGRMIDALAPGGWLVIEDGHFAPFAEQTLPDPYASVHRIIASGSMNEWHDPDFGPRVLGHLRDGGLSDLSCEGEVWTMRPGEPGGEWWFLALERALPRLVGAGLVSDDDAAQCLAQVRAPGFAMMSPLSIATWGRAQ